MRCLWGIGIVCLAALTLVSCQRAPARPERTLTTPPVRWTQDFPLEELDQQTLNEGECGLALWTKAQPAKRIFFARNISRSGAINFEGRTIDLMARHERGDLVRGFSPKQLYVGENVTVALDVEIETRQDVLSNAVIRSGVLTLTHASTRRSLVLPVVGVIGCS